MIALCDITRTLRGGTHVARTGGTTVSTSPMLPPPRKLSANVFREWARMSEQDNIDVVEEITEIDTDDGATIVEDTITVTDLDTGESVIDDTLVVEEADGSVTIDEVVAAVDADGNVEVLAEEVTEISGE